MSRTRSCRGTGGRADDEDHNIIRPLGRIKCSSEIELRNKIHPNESVFLTNIVWCHFLSEIKHKIKHQNPWLI